MSNSEFKAIVIGCATAVLIAVILLVGGYTKAQNDQAYIQIIADGMSERGFEEFMENRQMHGRSW